MAREAKYSIRAVDNTKQGLRSAENNLGGFQSSVSNISSKLTTGLVGLVSFKALETVAKGVMDVTRAWGVQEQAVMQLDRTVANSSLMDGSASQRLQDFASELQNTSIFGDEAIIAEMAKANDMFDLTEDQLESLASAATDYAASTGKTLEESFRNLGKTYAGTAGELSEVIPELKNLSQEQLEAGAAIQLAAEQFAGAAQTQAEGVSGALAQLGNTWGDFKEEIGASTSGLVAGISRFAQGILEVQVNSMAARRELDAMSDEERALYDMTNEVTVGLDREITTRRMEVGHLKEAVQYSEEYRDEYEEAVTQLEIAERNLGRINGTQQTVNTSSRQFWEQYLDSNERAVQEQNNLNEAVERQVQLQNALASNFRSWMSTTLTGLSELGGSVFDFGRALENIDFSNSPQTIENARIIANSLRTQLLDGKNLQQVNEDLADLDLMRRGLLYDIAEAREAVANADEDERAEAEEELTLLQNRLVYLEQATDEFESQRGELEDMIALQQRLRDEIMADPLGSGLFEPRPNEGGGGGSTAPAPQDFDFLAELFESFSSGFESGAFADALSGTIGSSELGQLAGSASGATAWLEALGGPIVIVVKAFLEAAMGVDSLRRIINPIAEVFNAMISILEPFIDQLLNPILGMLNIIGLVLGTLLIPVLQLMTPMLEVLNAGFLFLYNMAIRPVANAIIWAMNMINNAVATVWNAIANAINAVLGWAGVNVRTMAHRAMQEGFLEEIDRQDLDDASQGQNVVNDYETPGNEGTPDEGPTYEKQRDIKVNIYFPEETYLVGEGGMEEFVLYVQNELERLQRLSIA